MDRAPRLSGYRNIAAALLILCAILIAYAPAMSGGLVWDDDAHVTRPELQSAHGLWRIWFDVGATQQYYPLLHSAFWLEHRLWGDDVTGYHLLNLFLHAAAAWMVVLIVRRLALPGALLAGLLFAVHPVCVEAVAWISEQKSTLSSVFCLGSLLSYLYFDRSRRSSIYALAAGLFLLALLTKSVTAVLPGAVLVILWWQRGRLAWKGDVLPLLPWFAVGAASGLFTAWVEQRYVGAHSGLLPVQRVLIAGRAFWFYLTKIVLPIDLTFNYPHWDVNPGQAWQYLYPLGVVVLAAALVVVARKNRGPLAGFLLFAGTLFPALGFFNVFPFRYSYVADHFAYLASLGVIVPMAVEATQLAAFAAPRWRVAPGIVVAVILGMLTWNQSGMYLTPRRCTAKPHGATPRLHWLIITWAKYSPRGLTGTTKPSPNMRRRYAPTPVCPRSITTWGSLWRSRGTFQTRLRNTSKRCASIRISRLPGTA